MNRSATSFWPVLLRIAVGASWIVAGVSKIVNPAYGAALLAPTLTRWSTLGHSPTTAFIANSLLPNVGILSFLLKLAELLIGVALVLGFLTRVAALGGFLVIAAAWVLQGGSATLAGYGLGTFLEMITMLYLVLESSGHVLAVDALRSGRSRSQSSAGTALARPVTNPPEDPPQAPGAVT